MFSAPLSAPRAISGTVIRASGSGGVPGTNETRGSLCASLARTGLRWTTAQPVIPWPYGIALERTSSAHVPPAKTGSSSRRFSSAS